MLLTDGAARDLDELYAAAYDRGGSPRADLFLDRIQDVLTRLEAAPATGRPVPELQRLGVTDGRQQRDDDLRVLYRLRVGSGAGGRDRAGRAVVAGAAAAAPPRFVTTTPRDLGSRGVVLTWWRRRESNPRPEPPTAGVYARSRRSVVGARQARRPAHRAIRRLEVRFPADAPHRVASLVWVVGSGGPQAGSPGDVA